MIMVGFTTQPPKKLHMGQGSALGGSVRTLGILDPDDVWPGLFWFQKNGGGLRIKKHQNTSNIKKQKNMKKQSTNINKVLMWRWGSSSQRCWPLEIRLLKPCWHQPESAENDETKPVKPVVQLLSPCHLSHLSQRCNTGFAPGVPPVGECGDLA